MTAPVRGSNPPHAPASAAVVGRSGAAIAPVWANRSAQTILPVSSAEAHRSDIAPGKKPSSSVAYKVLIALVYLVAVSVILISLLLDRASCRRRTADPSATSQALPN